MALTDKLTLPKRLISAGAGLMLLFNVNCGNIGKPALQEEVTQALSSMAQRDRSDDVYQGKTGLLFSKGEQIGSFHISYKGENQSGRNIHTYYVETQIDGKSIVRLATINYVNHTFKVR